MPKQNRRVRVAMAVMLMAQGLTGCAENGDSPRDSSKPQSVTDHMVEEQLAAKQQTTSAPAEPAEPPKRPVGRAIATINGEPVGRNEFVEMLIDAHGLQLLQLVLLREAARQEADRLNLAVGEADIFREYDITAHAEHLNGKDVEALTPVRREQIVEEWTRSRGVSRAELHVAMEKQAILRKIAESMLASKTLSDAQVAREYRRVYGERVEVRHIQFDNQRVAQQIRERLDLGERFEDLVADYSQNSLTKIRQGLMPPFSADDESVPPILAKAAFELKEGEVSNPIEVEGYMHILKLERRIPADERPMEEVKPALERHIRTRMIEAKMEELGRRYLLGAKLQIKDKLLREKYSAAQKSGRIEGPPLVGQ